MIILDVAYDALFAGYGFHFVSNDSICYFMPLFTPLSLGGK